VPRRLIAVFLLVGVLASCGTTQDAAAINGVGIRTADLDQTVADFVTVGEAQLTNGVADGEAVRGILTSLIRAQATAQVIATAGESITDADRAAVLAQVEEQNLVGFPQTLLDLIVELNSATTVLGRIKVPSDDFIAEQYANNPKSLGMLCVRHLVVDNEALAKTAYAELGSTPSDDEFATVAGKYSIEPDAKESGGALAGQIGDCISINEWQAGFDPDFVAGALGARTGVPTKPIQSSFGWHVIYIRPFTAVAESVTANLTSAPGEYLLLGALADADITVASRYGRWNPLAGNVVAP
jgi:parvulin-like peptidyl-prolyl isomerase